MFPLLSTSFSDELASLFSEDSAATHEASSVAEDSAIHETSSVENKQFMICETSSIGKDSLIHEKAFFGEVQLVNYKRSSVDEDQFVIFEKASVAIAAARILATWI